MNTVYRMDEPRQDAVRWENGALVTLEEYERRFGKGRPAPAAPTASGVPTNADQSARAKTQEPHVVPSPNSASTAELRRRALEAGRKRADATQAKLDLSRLAATGKGN